MPYLLGIIVLVLEIICVIHAARTGRLFPWIYVIIMLPMVGIIAYGVVELMPDLMGARGVQSLRRNIVKMSDPTRDLRKAKRDSELVGSAEAKADLAEQHMLHGEYSEAVAAYESALVGFHADDPMLLSGLARAKLGSGDGAGAQAALDKLREANPEFSSADAHLIYARAMEMQGKDAEALEEYEALCAYFPGEEARCRHALLLQRIGRKQPAAALFAEILKRADGSPRHYRRVQKPWIDIARREISGAGAKL